MSNLGSYGAVVLAAGFSRRLPGENKLLRHYRGRPLLAHTLRSVASLGLDDAIVVVGYDAERVAPVAMGLGLRHVRNEQSTAGMGYSLAAGVESLSADLAGIFVVLGDMPEIRAEDYRRLAEAHEAQPARICVPVWNEQRGHPVLFGAAYRDALARLTGDVGARHVLSRHADHVVRVPASSPGVLADFDRRADFETGPASGGGPPVG